MPSEPFEPDFFVGREKISDELTRWATAPTVPKRLQLVAAPPGYGKSWLLQRLKEQLKSKPELCVVFARAVDLTSEHDIKNIVRANAPTVDAVEAVIAQFMQDLNALAHPARRPIIIVDALDEPSPATQQFIQRRFLLPFLRYPDTRLIIATRDDYSLTHSMLRRNEDRVILSPFSPDDGKTQLAKRFPLQQLPVNNADLLKAIEPYTLSVPGLNTCLYHIIKEHSLKFNAVSVNDCCTKAVKAAEPNLSHPIKDLRADLEKLLELPEEEETWTLAVFMERCEYNSSDALSHLDSLMKLGIVEHADLQRYKITDGWREFCAWVYKTQQAETKQKETTNTEEREA